MAIVLSVCERFFSLLTLRSEWQQCHLERRWEISYNMLTWREMLRCAQHDNPMSFRSVSEESYATCLRFFISLRFIQNDIAPWGLHRLVMSFRAYARNLVFYLRFFLPYGRQNNNSNGCTEIGAAVARCGGGEIRTLVQTRKQYAFYMLISASVVGHIQDRSYQYAP